MLKGLNLYNTDQGVLRCGRSQQLMKVTDGFDLVWLAFFHDAK
jgi:hypothetical protein